MGVREEFFGIVDLVSSIHLLKYELKTLKFIYLNVSIKAEPV
jgi:hypothetical protein